MKPAFAAAALAACAFFGAAHAQSEYNRVPSDDPQYRQCLRYASNRYTGGDEPSPVRGQTKVQAWCTCVWNETPDDFRGNLVSFSESSRGARINKMCEAYADWS
ncbi:hypothetical protein [Ramlibacter albus]|uniref:Uncharacterized protein n=1 Tax=Ramlibacter albus TaxID=2079448 RepID=A0A923M994_9BURK|nr:hypothetical protein [Ramlibacter albus]MBC5765104.1 hypothetical protein [Ramlibacter albus]